MREPLSKTRFVRTLFDSIAFRYDLINQVITLGQIGRWRKQVAKEVGRHKPRLVLDLGTGTGDLALALAREAGHAKVGIKIGTPVNGPGSVDLGEKLLNAGFLRRQVKVHPQCEAVIKGLRHARGGRADEDLKHALDAVRYVTYAPLTAMNTNRSSALRYQL